MLGWKSFAVHDSPMSWTPRRHRMLASSLSRGFVRRESRPRMLLICRTALSSVSSSVGGEIWTLTWPLECVLLWLRVSLPREGLALFIRFVWLHDRCDARPSVLLLLAESEHKLLFNTPPKKKDPASPINSSSFSNHKWAIFYREAAVRSLLLFSQKNILS